MAALKMCEGCGIKEPSYRLLWCGGCAPGKGVASLNKKKCEGCGIKLPSWKRRKRRCAGCAKAEGNGAVSLQKVCEGCDLKVPSYGLLAEGRRRWCAGCAKADGKGAVYLMQRKMCEDCGLKRPSHGLPGERRKRWCGGCAKTEGRGAVSLQKMCEGCGLKRPAFGLPAEGRGRWCAECAAAEGRGAVLLQRKKRRGAIGNDDGRSKQRRKKGEEVEASAGKQALKGQLLREQAKLGVIKEALVEQKKKIAETIAMIEDESVRPSVSSFSLIYC